MAFSGAAKRKIIEWVIILTIILVLISIWLLLLNTKKHSGGLEEDIRTVEVEGKVSIPYFVLAVDRSASMNEETSDPNNYEKEALKQVLRLLYWNGKQLYETASFYPRIKMMSFSGAPESLLQKDKWVELSGDAGVFELDKRIDEVLTERNGQFTDINAVVENLIQIKKSVPSVLHDQGEERPTSFVFILFTDGAIYPNYINEINHHDPESWADFKENTLNLIKKTISGKKSRDFEEEMQKRNWIDPIDWALNNAPGPEAKNFKSRYYAMNADFGIENQNKFSYARDTVQNMLHQKIEQMMYPSVRFNIIALIQGEKRKEELNYLKNWTDDLGFFYHINQASDLGTAFSTLMSDYLNSHTEFFAVKGAKRLPPFSEDVKAAQLTISFPDDLADKKLDDLVHLYSPRENEADTQMNKGLRFSRFFYITEEDYEDFHNDEGWRIEVSPIQVSGKIYEKANCILTTFHLYNLQVEKVETESIPFNTSRYVFRIVDPHAGDAVAMQRFSKIPQFEVNLLGKDEKIPYEIQYNVNKAKDGINADFIDWPAGKYNVKIELVGGQLKGDSLPLRTRAVTQTLIIGDRIKFYNQNGEEIRKIGLGKIDRK